MPLYAASAQRHSGAPLKPRVLVVDDEPQVLLAVDDLLGDDYRVSTAGSAAQALQLMHDEHDIAVVISDQRMPNMTGAELLERVQDLSSASRILFTGFADLTAVIRAVNHGKIFAYVTKPWQADDLRMLIRKAVEHFELSADLRSERQLLHDLMNSAQDGICFKDRELRYVRGNRAFEALYAPFTQTSPLGHKLSQLLPDSLAVHQLEVEEATVISCAEPAVDRVWEVSRHYLNTRSWYSTTSTPLRNQHGEVIGVVGITRDVTQRKQQEERIARLTRIHEMRSGINSTIVRIHERPALLSEACHIAAHSGKLARALAIDCTNLQDLQLLAAHGDDSTELPAWLAQLITQHADAGCLVRGEPLVLNELEHDSAATLALLPLCVDGRLDSVFALFATQRGFFDAQELALLVELCDNISLALDHAAQRKRLNFLAYYDELTGLPKRELLDDRLNQLFTSEAAEQRAFALILLELKGLDFINESLGRRTGDQVLRALAQRLSAGLEPQLTLARFDAQIFALLVPRIEREAQAAAMVESQLLPAFEQPFAAAADGNELRLGCRIGIALFPGDGKDPDSLIRSAEAALKQVGTTGQRYLFCAPGMTERAAEKLSFETKLRRAVEHGEFVLHYQPKVDLNTGSVVGLEALVRWQDPGGELIAPTRFIPMLEDTGLILEVGRWVMMRAAEQFTEWSNQGVAPPPIAVNVSALQLGQPDFLRTIEDTIRMYPMARGGLDLEITESMLVDDLSGNIEKLKAVRESGLRVAIDDFGTGYSSLGYLSRLPVDALKVDRSFVSRMGDDPHDMTIVMAIISLAHAIGLKVIAEGSETAAQVQQLRLLKCDQLQGYCFARPQPADRVIELFLKRLQFT